MRSPRLALAVFGAITAAAPALARPDYASFDRWRTASGAFDTITFAELAGSAALRDQFLAQGIRFDGSDAVIPDSRFFDGSGAFARDNYLTIEFTHPARAIGADYVGQLLMVLYSGQDMVHSAYLGHRSADQAFGGVVSPMAFARVVITNRYESAAEIDNVHWSLIPGPGGAAVLLAAAVICALPRRR